MQQVLMHRILLKNDLANLKSDADKLDIDSLKNVPSNLSNLKSKVDKSDVNKLVPDAIKKTKCDELVKIAHAIQTSNLVKKD